MTQTSTQEPVVTTLMEAASRSKGNRVVTVRLGESVADMKGAVIPAGSEVTVSAMGRFIGYGPAGQVWSSAFTPAFIAVTSAVASCPVEVI